MNVENVPEAKKDRSSVILQALAFIFAFLSTSFLLGSGFLAAVLSSAVSCADYLSKRGRLCFLGSVLGGGAGYVFTAFVRDSVVRLIFDAALFGKEFSLVFDLRLHALVLFLFIPLLSFVFCSCVAKRASRSVCVAASTGVIAVAMFVQLAIFCVGKYSDFSFALLKEKLGVLIGLLEGMLSGENGKFWSEYLSGYPGTVFTAEQFSKIASAAVYSLPSVAALFCGALAFLHSFCVKRALGRSGALGFIYTDGWIFIPGIVTAVVYIVLFVVMTLSSLFSGEQDEMYFGLNVIVTLLSGAFLITGVTAVRWFVGVRSRAGMKFSPLWIAVLIASLILFPTVIVSLVRLAGLAMVFLREASRRKKEPPES
ncbi:MAG: hypothetical protein IJV00_01755 [Clostridia bacterium]|nr:hypothetical protein [Clostridia bacterium]